MQYPVEHTVYRLQFLRQVGVLVAQRVLYLSQLGDLRQRHHGQQVLVIVIGVHITVVFGLSVNGVCGLAQCLLVLGCHSQLVCPALSRARIIWLIFSFNSVLLPFSVSLFPNLITLFSSLRLFINISLFSNAFSSSRHWSSFSYNAVLSRATSSANNLTLCSIPATVVSKSNICFQLRSHYKKRCKITHFFPNAQIFFCNFVAICNKR